MRKLLFFFLLILIISCVPKKEIITASITGAGSSLEQNISEPIIVDTLSVTADAIDPTAKVEFSKTDPAVTLDKWNGSTQLKLNYNDITAGSTLDGEKATWDSASQKLESYVLNDSSGIEIALILKEPPASNVFSFQLQGDEDLDFLYQPPLDEQPENLLSPGIVSCNATDCIDAKGVSKRHRPENVVGSYAVYHKTLKDNTEGGTNYATGKAFHLYRPLLIDANNQTVWGDLSYNEGVLSVIVSQKFLDSATYPVIVDPTFGFTSVGGTTNSISPQIRANTFTSNVDAGTVSKISWYVDNNAGNFNFGTAIYSDVAGAPNGKLAEDSGNVLVNGAAQWWNSTISTPISASTTYYLALWGDNSYRYYYDTGGGSYFGCSGTFETWPSSCSSSNVNEKWSVYATYTSALSSIFWYQNSTNDTIAGNVISHNVFWNSTPTNNSNYTFYYFNGTNTTNVLRGGDEESSSISLAGTGNEVTKRYNFSNTQFAQSFTGTAGTAATQTFTVAQGFATPTASTSTCATNLSTSDNTYCHKLATSTNEEIYQRYHFSIQEDRNNISWINMVMESARLVASGTEDIRPVYMNWSGPAWQILAADMTTEATVNLNVTDNANVLNIINSSGNVTLELQGQDFDSATEEIETDFAQVEIGYKAPITEQDSSYTTYSDTISIGSNPPERAITNITVRINVTSYNSNASITNKNRNATIGVELYNGSGYWDIGNFSINNTGIFNISTTEPGLLLNWTIAANTDLRVRGRNLDWNASSLLDNITYSDIEVWLNTTQEYVNDSTLPFTSSMCLDGANNLSRCWSNISKTSSGVAGTIVKWFVTANNTDSNINQTNNFSYTLTSAAGGAITYCYQESANQTTLCGGRNTGLYATTGTWGQTSNLSDASYTTFSTAVNVGSQAIFYVNYTKPNSANASSLWQIKDEGAITNLTFTDSNNSCWNAYSTILQLRAISSEQAVTDSVQWDCYNGTGWWNQRNSTGVVFSAGDVYEEGMHWAAATTGNFLVYCNETIQMPLALDGLSTNLRFIGSGTLRPPSIKNFTSVKVNAPCSLIPGSIKLGKS